MLSISGDMNFLLIFKFPKFGKTPIIAHLDLISAESRSNFWPNFGNSKINKKFISPLILNVETKILYVRNLWSKPVDIL